MSAQIYAGLVAYISTTARALMPKCGVCGWSFGGWAMTKHAETPCGEDDRKAEARPYTPEIDDLIKMEEEASE
jgi:hypothetical protein